MFFQRSSSGFGIFDVRAGFLTFRANASGFQAGSAIGIRGILSQKSVHEEHEAPFPRMTHDPKI